MKKILFVMMSVLVGTNAFAASSLVSGANQNKNTALQSARSGSLKMTSGAKGTGSGISGARIGVLPINYMVKGNSVLLGALSNKQPVNQNSNSGDFASYGVAFEADDEAVYWTLADQNGVPLPSATPKELFKFSELTLPSSNVQVPEFRCENGKIWYTYYGKWVLLDGDSSCGTQTGVNGINGADGEIPMFSCNENGKLAYTLKSGQEFEIEDSNCLGEAGKNAPLPIFRCEKNVLKYSVNAKDWKVLEDTNLCSSDDDIKNIVKYNLDNISCKNGRIQIGKTVTDIKCNEFSELYKQLHCEGKTKTVWVDGKDWQINCSDAKLMCYGNEIFLNEMRTYVYGCENTECKDGNYMIRGRSTGIPCTENPGEIPFYADLYCNDGKVFVWGSAWTECKDINLSCNENQEIFVNGNGTGIGNCDKVKCESGIYVINGKTTYIPCESDPTIQNNYYSDLYCNQSTGTVWGQGNDWGIKCGEVTKLHCADEIDKPDHIRMEPFGKEVVLYACESLECSDKDVYTINGLSTGIACDHRDLCNKHGYYAGTSVSCDWTKDEKCIDGFVYVDGGQKDIHCELLPTMYCDWRNNEVVFTGKSTGWSCDKLAIGCDQNNNALWYYSGLSQTGAGMSCDTFSTDATGMLRVKDLYTGIKYNEMFCAGHVGAKDYICSNGIETLAGGMTRDECIKYCNPRTISDNK